MHPSESPRGQILTFVVCVKCVKVAQSCPTLCEPLDCTGVGSLSLLQGVFPTQGSNPGLPHCRQILYQLGHNGSPNEVKCKLRPTRCNPMDYAIHGILQARILEWVAFPFSRGSSQPRDRTQVSCIAGGFFTS